MIISSEVLRGKFLEFFMSRGHYIVKSSSLVPINDKSLLFVNSGMVQFKDVFMGLESIKHNKICSIQKCIRAGGKHNDFYNVGHDNSHHVFFEMLGNFSFNNYFKEGACVYAWEFLTKELCINADNLVVSVFNGDNKFPFDESTYNVWKRHVGISDSKIIKKEFKDNFWHMGDIGPCGPCTEIYYINKHNITMEVWNIVFMEYEKKKDQSLVSLPYKCVDTGMGLERLCTVVNDFENNYQSDLFKTYIDFCKNEIFNFNNVINNDNYVSLKIIADHCRAIVFIIGDGVLPSNDGRGYVLRKIIRRVLKHIYKIKGNKFLLYKICLLVIANMGNLYNELKLRKSLIKEVVQQEEILFCKTLDRGAKIFTSIIRSNSAKKIISGDIVFKLYDSYGLPVDITQILADKNNIKIEWSGFEKAKLQHTVMSGKNISFCSVNNIYSKLSHDIPSTVFIQDYNLNIESHVLVLLLHNTSVNMLNEHDVGMVCLNKTVFYGESGGQVGDIGVLYNKNCNIIVYNTKKIFNLYWHYIKINKGQIKVGDILKCTINVIRRNHIKRHHSATHLLHYALRYVCGKHIVQHGSLVDDKHLRFDFSYFKDLSDKQIIEIEHLVNDLILKCDTLKIFYASYDLAKKKYNAIGHFDRKYSDLKEVRIVQLGHNSIELCGGSHVENTGEIGQFKIINSTKIAFGVRRIEAIAGFLSLDKSIMFNNILTKISRMFVSTPNKVIYKLNDMFNELKTLKKQIKTLKSINLSYKAKLAINNVIVINKFKVIIEYIYNIIELNDIRSYIDCLKKVLHSSIIVLVSKKDMSTIISLSLTNDINNILSAKILIKKLINVLGGNGGGNNIFAQMSVLKIYSIKFIFNEIKKIIFNMQ